MRIAILGSVALPVPPPMQGGTEWIAYHQAEGLARLGHKVILFAAYGSRQGNYRLVEVGGGDTVAGSKTNAVILGTKEVRTPESDSGLANARQNDELVESSRNLRKENVYLAQVQQELIDRKDEYDVIMNNMRGEAGFLPLAKLLGKKFVNVMHLPLFPELASLFKQYNTYIITISNAQRRNFPDLNYLATVYNCVDTSKYVMLNSFQHPQQIPKQVRDDTNDDYLLMMGSIAPHKNQLGAIRVAKKLGMDLVLAGKIGDKNYFDKIKSEIDGVQIQWVGELGFEAKMKLYQHAKAFIFPVLWEEPFGLVMIEAMACGTPVVAFANGAIPEVVVDGLTGFVIESSKFKVGALWASSKLRIQKRGDEGLIEAIKTISRLSAVEYLNLRLACRRHVEEKFTVEKMVKDYEKALLSLI